jgi:tetratricopeptide (TPR) repeat protein
MNKKKRRRSNFSQDRFPTPLFRAVRGLYSRFVYTMTWPVRAFFSRGDRKNFRKASLFRRLQFPFRWVLGFIIHSAVSLADLIFSWSQSRQIRALFYGLPAVLSIGFVIFVITFLSTRKERNLVDSYLLQATSAENRERFETARLYYQKLRQLDPFNQSYDYYMARSFDAEGKEEEAFLRMQKLLKSTLSGSVNYWFAIKTIDREDLDDETRWKLILRHLSLFLKGRARHLQANQLATDINIKLADYYQTRNQTDEYIQSLETAITHASRAAVIQPKLYLPMARIQARLAESLDTFEDSRKRQQFLTDSIDSAERYVSFYEDRIEDHPTEIDNLLLISDGHLFQKRYDKALASLDAASRADIGRSLSSELAGHKSNVLAAWAGYLLGKGTDDLTRCMELVNESIQLNTKNPRALGVLAQITVLKNRSTAEKAQKILDQALANSVAPLSVHLILGENAAKNKDYELAVKHFRQALLVDRRAPAIMNNLALVLTRLPEPHFEESLTLIESALKILPNNPYFLNTRGDIYLSMDQLERAFHNFELAEIRMKDNPTLYENLINLSKKLGFESHQRKYEQKLQTLQATARKTIPLE